MTTLERYGFGAAMRASAGAIPAEETFGRIVSAHGDYFHVVCDQAEGEVLARKKTSAFRSESAVAPTTGDFVRLVYNPSGESRITGVVPRISSFMRVDPSSSGHKAQTIAVNFDALFLLMGVNADFSVARLGRVLELADASACRQRLAVLLTKSDLADDGRLADLSGQLAPFGVPVHPISVKTGRGMDVLETYAAPGRTFAFIGSSGVGKSSLVNALAGEEWLATQEIQHWSGKGRHTTTSRELVMLPSGLMVIDTPGMRELGVMGRDGTHRFHSSGTHRYRR
ncbi:MAG: GTPase RsgA [Kiritimatiellae bacterium]|nr:GTPase RsgA [Kiritimatiellia bacterium]